MSSVSMPLRRLLLSLSLVAVAAAFTACGNSDEEVRHAHSEGVYVTTGELRYQVQISRQLNPASFQDKDYLVGVDDRLPKGEQFFGVFLRVFNKTDERRAAAQRYYLTDTTGKRYEPMTLSEDNRVAFRPETVAADSQLPQPGSFADTNPTRGGMLLFQLPVVAYDSRPLTFHIESSGDDEASVDLDV